MGEKDRTEKMLEAYDDVFADIVNSLVFDGEEILDSAELEEQVPERHYVTAGKLHGIERDIVKRWVNGSIRIACIGFENQSKTDYDMPLRTIGYDGAEYRAQLLDDGKGSRRYPVITLVLYFGKEHWSGPVTLKDRLDIPEKLEPFVNDYRLNLYEMAYLTDEQIEKFKSDFYAVVEFLRHKRENKIYRQSKRDLKHPYETIRLISAMTKDSRIEKIYDELVEEKGQVSNMCELIDAFIEQGEEQGIDKAKINIAKNLLSQGIMSYEEIAEATNLSVEQVKELDTPVTA